MHRRQNPISAILVACCVVATCLGVAFGFSRVRDAMTRAAVSRDVPEVVVSDTKSPDAAEADADVMEAGEREAASEGSYDALAGDSGDSASEQGSSEEETVFVMPEGADYEPDVALLRVEPDADPNEVSAILAQAEGVVAREVSAEEIATGLVEVEVASGSDVESAVNELIEVGSDAGVDAQPNYIYYTVSDRTPSDLMAILKVSLMGDPLVTAAEDTLMVDEETEAAETQAEGLDAAEGQTDDLAAAEEELDAQADIDAAEADDASTDESSEEGPEASESDDQVFDAATNQGGADAPSESDAESDGEDVRAEGSDTEAVDESDAADGESAEDEVADEESSSEGEPDETVVITDGEDEAGEEEPEIEELDASDFMTTLADSVSIDDPKASQQWALFDIKAYQAWAIAKCEGSVTVAVLDSGFQVTHSDLAANMLTSAARGYTSSSAAYGTDVSPVVSSGYTDYWHGTHVAGIISGIANNGVGIAGVSYNAKILPVRVFYGSGSSAYSNTKILCSAFSYVTNNASKYNVRVINLSVGSTLNYYSEGYSGSSTVADAALYAEIDAARDKGIVTVVAAGNNASSGPYEQFPGDYENAVSVINMTSSHTRYSSSNYNTVGQTAKNISAPGASIYSTAPTNSYRSSSGTSMAAPCVAGVLALEFAVNPQLTAEEAVDILYASATDIGDEGWDRETGYGEVNAYQAVKAAYDLTDVSLATVTLSQNTYDYDGTAKKPTATVVLNGTTLTAGTDYSISYANNVNMGTARVTITGKGSYTGSNVALFTISARNISDAAVTLSQSLYTYDGTAKKPEVVVVIDGKTTLTKGTDYTVSYSNNTAAGTAKVIIAGTGSCTGSIEVPFTIEDCDLSDAVTIALSQSSYTYDGTAKKPTVSVTHKGSTLKENEDYSVTYSNNTNVGTATVTITGQGSFTGKKMANFVIKARSVADATITLSQSSYVYDGTAKTPVVTVNYGSSKLAEGTDYTVTYSNNVSAGTAKVTIKGKGSYAGSKATAFSIMSCDMANTTVMLSGTSFVYTGSARKPSVTVRIAGVALSAGTDYTVTYASNVNVGTARVTIKGKGNCTGSKTVSFAITARSITAATISLSPTSYTYDGSAKRPTVSATYNGATLKLGTAYTVKYANNVEPGTATVTITGKGNFTGSKTLTFKITKSTAAWKRLYGATALDTMKAIVNKSGFSTGGTVILATSTGYWDALSAAGIAGLAQAPVLMTSPTELSTQTAALLKTLKPKKIIICGGTSALSSSVASAAKSASGATTVKRCWGQNAIETACQIFLQGKTITGESWATTGFLCTVSGYWDALSAAPLAYKFHMPIFLTNKDALSSATLSAMKKGGIKSVYVVGGTAAISSTVVTQLKANGITVTSRLAGQNAIETSIKVANLGLKLGMSPTGIVVASVNGYWDALSGAAFCGSNGWPVVLIGGTSDASVYSFIKSNANHISYGYVLGGTAAVSSSRYTSLVASTS